MIPTRYEKNRKILEIMKWFWRINYIISIYLFLILGFYLPVGTEFGSNKWFNLFANILTINNVLLFFTMIIEWIQFPLCLIAMIIWKEQRTTKHFLFLSILVFLNLIKWIFWFLSVGSLG